MEYIKYITYKSVNGFIVKLLNGRSNVDDLAEYIDTNEMFNVVEVRKSFGVDNAMILMSNNTDFENIIPILVHHLDAYKIKMKWQSKI